MIGFRYKIIHINSKTFYIGRKAPKGYEELVGGIHLGKGIWVLPIRKIPKKIKPRR
jgi:hypothetical protein